MHMNKMNYTSAAALLADFNAGAKFALVNGDGPEKKVTRMEARAAANAGFVLWAEDTAGPWREFLLDGSHASSTRRLVKLADAPCKDEPFDMKVFVSTGREAIVPATGEKLVSFMFSANSLEVVLEDAKGNHRVSTNYRHDGSHKWQPKRSLVFKPLPPKTRKIRLEIVQLAGQPGKFSARILGLDGDAFVPAAIGSVVAVGYAGKRATTVYGHDFEVAL
jgi:hypothetical protein